MKLSLLKMIFGTLMSWGFISIAEAQDLAEVAQIMEPIFKNLAYMGGFFSGIMTGTAVVYSLFFKKEKK